MKNNNLTSIPMENLKDLIGKTPLIEIFFTYKGEERRIFAKAENYNLTGSIKDRMALYILKKSYENNLIKPTDRIVEATSGNTGISFSALGSLLGHEVTIFMPDWMSEERIKLIKSYGADVKLVSAAQGGFIGSINLTRDLAKENDNIFLPKQFSNEYNSQAHYSSTGPEIWNQLKDLDLVPDAVVAGVGTGGTIMGIGKYLREQNKNIKVHPLEPSNSPTLSTGGKKIKNHRIQGISDEFIPALLDLNSLDRVISVDDGDSIIMAQKLASHLGLGLGISSGANFLGALKAQEILGKDSIVVTVFSDDNKKYLSTELMEKEPVKEGFISTDIKLLGLKSHK